MLGSIFFVVVATLVAGAATAGPRSIADCETIQAADAYNRCLASFGPSAGRRGRSFGADVSAEGDYSRPEHRSGMAEQGRKGRVRMVLEPPRGAR